MGVSGFELVEMITDTADLIEFEDASVGKDAKPDAKPLGENAGAEQADTAIGVHCNTF